jgi:predicted acetyltransferase
MKTSFTYSGVALNNNDRLLAIELVENVFYKNKKGSFLFPERENKCENVILVKSNNDIIATCFILNKEMYFDGELVPVSFLCNICVSPKFRGNAISEVLMKTAIDLCIFRNKKASFVIATKAVDYYYTKFNFYGISSYSSINVKKNNVFLNKKNSISLVDFKEEDIEDVSVIYTSIYTNLLGSFYRSKEDWKFCIQKAQQLSINFMAIFERRNIIGFIVYTDNKIKEIAINNSEQYVDVLAEVFKATKMESIYLEVSPKHPIVQKLKEFDFTIKNRQCWYGGHMMRIHDDKYFLNKQTNKILFSSKMNIKKFSDLIDLHDLSNPREDSKIFNIPLLDQI